MAGVHFMAETAKLLNPTKTVLIPDPRAGCSLAESITAEDVALLRQAYPGVPVVTYVNTSAAVKAESDICCTSANAVKVVESLGVAAGHHAARRIPRQERRRADEGRDHRLARPLRGARAVHRARHPRVARSLSRRRRAGASRMPAGGGRGGRFRRLDRGDDRLCRRQAAGARGAGDRVLDERQRRGPLSRRRVRAALQSLPAHEADHAAPRSAARWRRCSTKSRSIRRSPRRRAAPSSGCWRCDRRTCARCAGASSSSARASPG